MADKTEVNYEQLQQIMKMFSSEAEEINGLQKQTQSRVEDLHGGNWIGKGADKFFDEMQSEVLPALRRLAAGLQEAAQVTQRILDTYRQAEEETQGFFNSVGN